MRHLHPVRVADATPRYARSPYARHGWPQSTGAVAVGAIGDVGVDGATGTGIFAGLRGNGNAAEPALPACFGLIERLRSWCGVSDDAPLDCGALAVAAADLLGFSDPIVAAHPAPLAGLDGALYRTGTGGWVLLYDVGLDHAQARLAQAFLLGCYALRGDGTPPDSIEFRMGDLDGPMDDGSLAARAYGFAARLLMPLAGCRGALAGTMDFERAERYALQCGVPIIHVVRRWLSYTADKAVLLLADGARIHASWASETACAAGLQIACAGRAKRSVPAHTLARDPTLTDDICGSLVPAQRWFGGLAGEGMLREMKLALPQLPSEAWGDAAVSGAGDRRAFATLLIVPRELMPERAGGDWPHGCARHV